MSNNTRAKVQDVFRDVFANDGLELTDDLDPDQLAAWDSLGHIRLIAALEDALSVSFTLEEIEAMTSVERILAIVSSKG